MSAEPVAILKSKSGVSVPLQRVAARGRLEGLVLELTVEQHYENTSAANLEAVFTFPLPLHAVLLGFDLELGNRKLAAVAVARPEASERYEEAIDDGNTAALVEHDGNGLYTVSLGNLLAGEKAVIRYRYAQLLDAHGRYVRINVPTVIAPRYGDARDAGLEGPAVPGVDVLGEYPFDLTFDLVGLDDASAVRSPSHRIAVTRTDLGLTAALQRSGFLDRDFVLELEAAAVPDRTLVAADGDGFVALACPRLAAEAEEHRPLALKVLLDCSGSMAGDSIQAAKRALAAILGRLGPADSVSLTRFGSHFEHVTEGLEPADEHTLPALKLRVREIEADLGGTEMANALGAAVAIPVPRSVNADLVLITDGEIYAVDRVVKLAAQSRHRLFAVAIGAAPNEALARALAEKTGGACEFVAPGEEAEQAILRTFKRLRSAPRTVTRVDWPASPTWTAPAPAAVFAGDTLHLFAGFDRFPSGPTTVTVSDAAGPAHGIVMAEAAAATAGDLLPRLAAARRLPALSEQAATELAVRYQLATQHTSFVVVAERSDAEKASGLPATVAVPQMLAAGWGGQGSVNLIVASPAAPLRAVGFDAESRTRKRSHASASLLVADSFERLDALEMPASYHATEVSERTRDADDVPGLTGDALELADDVRDAALRGLAASYRAAGRLPATLAELVAAAALPEPWARLLETLIAAGQPENMVVAVFIALLARSAAPDALDADVRSACEGAVFRERRYRELRRRLEARVG